MLLLVCVLLLSMSLADAQPAPSQAQAYMRVIQDNGVWWFQDGTRRTFFSLGVNCVGGCYGHAEATPMLPARHQWIVALLHAWGFNTAGCWSSPSVWPDFYVTEHGTQVLAHGRDPNFPGWPDTLQLNYANPGLQAAQRTELLSRELRRALATGWNAPGRPRVRINAVGFFYESPEVGAFLWALARENDGSFVGMSRP